MPVALRLAAAANARASGGSSVCSWLRDAALPRGLDTGCREGGEEGGFVYARPDRQSGTEVVSRSAGGDEAVLLRWPRWLLFPAVSRPAGELFFVDAEGVWSVPLAGGTPPRTVLPGSFRFLALPPGGTGGAAARWPEGTVTMLDGATPAGADVRAIGGLTWLQGELLLASDRNALTVVSVGGETRPWPGPVSCVCSLTAAGGSVLAGVTTPCTPALARLSPAGTAQETLVTLPDAPVGIVPRPRGAVCFGSADGLWLWDPAGTVERIGAGLTPGPG